MIKKRLSEMVLGEQGLVSAVTADPETADQWLELGIGVDEEISMEGASPFGDPIIVGLMNYRLAIRKSDAAKILVQINASGRK